jgi:tetratricopeptide (TPR) repeat protein
MEADPRYLGQAESVLSPWWDNPAASASVWILRGGIEQHRHEFDAAIQSLKRAVHSDPRNAQGWLTLASIYTVRGQFTEARSAGLHLVSLTDDLTVICAMAGVTSMIGSAESALTSIEGVLTRYSHGSDPSLLARRVWGETLAGEIAERLGRNSLAETHFRNALNLHPADPYVLGDLADFLLQQGRQREAARLLDGFDRFDALRQRRAEALIPVEGRDSKVIQTAIETLSDRFKALALRGERVHMREESRFRLRLLEDKQGAQLLAVENWKVQREAADVRLLLETSMLAGNREGVLTATEWIKTNQTEDAVFQKLAMTAIASR